MNEFMGTAEYLTLRQARRREFYRFLSEQLDKETLAELLEGARDKEWGENTGVPWRRRR